jgi:hypothetical protein
MRGAQQSYHSQEDTRKRFSRTFFPAPEHPPPGEQAVLDYSFGNTTATATLIARKGIRLVVVQFTTPASVPAGQSTDPKHYTKAKEPALQVAAGLLK